ncbi:MAG: HXXEE domain-containing protein [Rhodovulum sp.]
MKRILRNEFILKRVGLSARATLMFVAFALQNTEETLFLPAWLEAQRPEFDWPGPAQYGVAAMLLTLTAAVIVIVAGQRRFAGLWGWVLACLSGALLMNAVTHVLMSLANLSLMPGVVSGVVVMGPAAIWMLTGLVQEGRLSLRGAAVATLIGTALTPLASGAALRGSAWLLA